MEIVAFFLDQTMATQPYPHRYVRLSPWLDMTVYETTTILLTGTFKIAIRCTFHLRGISAVEGRLRQSIWKRRPLSRLAYNANREERVARRCGQHRQLARIYHCYWIQIRRFPSREDHFKLKVLKRAIAQNPSSSTNKVYIKVRTGFKCKMVYII
jgi:hypothetical protein